ncbi:YncE family protein [Streptomyces sp. NPDC002790]|uniref:YncE family protein n=1 Tax=Streptomyces sp. NPDC002790 TaxID=3154431 RepID=UPI00331C3896
MPRITPSIRRSAAVAVALIAGATLAPAAAANADTGATASASVPVTKGLYQSAYSERNHALWTTSAVGRPPVTTSALTKLDPVTLKVEATYTPPVTDAATGAVEAVYGIAVDDEHNTVWVTNTRDNSVAVYSQRDGSHLATLPNVNHAREIVVDEKHDTVWASGFGDGSVVGFDSRTFTEKKRVTVEGAGPTGLTVNERNGTVYAADLTNDQLIEVARKSTKPRLIPAGDGPISVALSKNGRTAYTADNVAGTVSVVDLNKGLVTKSVPTGEGTLSVASDDRSGKLVAVNRTDATATVVDPRKGSVVKTVSTGANPNHVEVARGTAYVVDKSGTGPAGEDTLTRFRVR